ncbi:MAG: outer membrane beta-barrel protein [Candidatus Zixiibacteriota bacterium]
MRKYVKCFSLSVLLVASAAMGAVADDTAKLRAELDKLEASLTALKQQVSAQPTQVKPAAQKQAATPSAQVAVAPAQPAIASQPSVADNAPAVITETEWQAILAEIEYLKVENEYLNALLGEPSGELASADGMTTSATRRQSIEELRARVAELHGSQPQPASASSDASAEDALSLNGLSVAGFIDIASNHNHNTSDNSIGLDQVEIDLVKDFEGRAAFLADIEYVHDGAGAFDFDLEQGYVTVHAGHTQKWSFSLGKFNAPIGWEVLEPADYLTNSYGLVFTYGLPTNFTGLMVSTQFPSVFDWKVYAVNGWDVNADNNTEKTFGTRLGITPVEQFNLGLSFLSGAEQDNNNASRRTVLDADMTLYATPTWTVSADVSYGMESKAISGTEQGTWSGGMLMNRFSLSNRFALTFRGDYFNDTDGLRTETIQERWAVAAAPSMSIVDGLGAIFELRYDKSNRMSFTDNDGLSTDHEITSSLLFDYAF